MQNMLEHASSSLFSSIKNNSPFINQMMEVKQLAWLTRQSAGEGSLLLATGIVKGSLAPDARVKFAGFAGGVTSLWAAIDDSVAGMKLPSAFLRTLAEAKQTLLAPEYRSPTGHN